MKDYLLSIVMPTRNRAKYAELSVRQILNFCNGEIELIIQDNGDTDELKRLLSDILERKDVVYNYEGNLLSFVDNFDHALNLAKGEYIIMIGDDDGITSELLRMVKWAKRNDIEAIKPNLNLVYFWPGSKVYSSEKDTGILKVTNSTGNYEKKDPHQAVISLLSNSCQDYLELDMIKIYHGFVKRELLLKIKDKIGKFVGGLSPDIYLSVALSLLAEKKLVAVDIPLTISGICNASGSSASSTGAHTGRLEDAPHLKGHVFYKWSSKIPQFYSVETIWADSALAAVCDIEPSIEKYYKPEKLFDVVKSKYKDFFDVAKKNYEENGGTDIKYWLWKMKSTFLRVKKSIKYRMSKHIIKEWNGVTDISSASKIIESELADLYSDFHKKINE